ncbi:glycine--tRNA ligase subunit alpha [Buchnera aphidicola (Ceratoglyphina bambusae)]|uniref:glycine--tRNA ligase subunit alpha n=1 Tax=Buchnera aphidicola TaxID=9 RepID=UPI0031B8012A
MNNKKKTLQKIIKILEKYWESNGCTIVPSIDLPVGAGTFHKETFFNSILSKNFSRIYLQACRRPSDSRNANSKNRLQHYYQMQVVINPPPKNIQELYIKSLKKLDINPKKQDIRFIEDNWENKTIGASGIGWEIRINGIEVTQFTYFQKIGSLECNPSTIEITYGLERIAMHIQNIDNIYKLIWNKNKKHKIKYKDLYLQNEIEQSSYNFKFANIKEIFTSFKRNVKESERLIMLKNPLIFPSYEYMLIATHKFNILESRKYFSITERQNYISKIRGLSKKIAIKYCIKNNASYKEK